MRKGKRGSKQESNIREGQGSVEQKEAIVDVESLAAARNIDQMGQPAH